VRSPAHEGVKERQRFAGPSTILELATPDHKYEHLICPRLAAVAPASRHLNDVTTDINIIAETLLTVVQPCEQLMHVTSLMLTIFWVPV
jgi:hypothetical protein